ncbi:hypothetical protein ACB092_02G178300 [Castanea dentata]
MDLKLQYKYSTVLGSSHILRGTALWVGVDCLQKRFKYVRKRTIDDVVKKDREYWTAVMDDALIDALLHQHHLGNRNGSIFTTHAYDNIVKELQEKFEKPIDKQKVKNCIKTIKYNWSNCYDVFKNGLSGFAWSLVTKMCSVEPEVWESLI